jgi:hypothetical protein
MDTLQLVYAHTEAGKVKVHKWVGKDPVTNADLYVPIATPFGIVARLRLYDLDGAYGMRVRVQGMDGQPRDIDFERSELAKMGGAEIRAALFREGLRTEQDGEATAVSVLKSADPELEISVVSRPGWHAPNDRDASVFATPGGEIIGDSGSCNGVELSFAARILPKSARAGTLDGWSKAISAAVSVRDCPHWVLGAISVFCGPVLEPAGLDSCGFNLSGLSSSGKTLAQKLAASGWASPKLGAGLLKSLRVTENSVESFAQQASGTLLALDEMAHTDGKVISRLIYSIAGGIGKARMTSAATLRRQYLWTTFAMLSGECSLEEKVRQDGGQWMAGMAVRIVDVDVTGINRMVDKETLAAISAIDRNYGHAGPAFVRAMVEAGIHRDPDTLRERINRAASAVAGHGADGARMRAAVPFAVLLVAGQLAKGFGILPADTPVSEVVGWAWKRFETSSDAVALTPEEQAVGNLRQRIAELWGVSIRNVSEVSGNKEAIGWFDDDAIYIPVTRIREMAGSTLKGQLIAQVLNGRGLLARRHDAKRLALRTIPMIGKVDCYALKRSEFGRMGTSRPHLRTVGDE